MIYSKGSPSESWKKNNDDLSKYHAWTLRHPSRKKIILALFYINCTKINSRCITELHVRHKIIKFLGDNINKYHYLRGKISYSVHKTY